MDKLKGVGARARALAEAARRNGELGEARNEMAQAFRALGEAHYAKDTYARRNWSTGSMA